VRRQNVTQALAIVSNALRFFESHKRGEFLLETSVPFYRKRVGEGTGRASRRRCKSRAGNAAGE
jgi:hypothetical protein